MDNKDGVDKLKLKVEALLQKAEAAYDSTTASADDAVCERRVAVEVIVAAIFQAQIDLSIANPAKLRKVLKSFPRHLEYLAQ